MTSTAHVADQYWLLSLTTTASLSDQYWFFFTPPALAPLVVLFSETLMEAETLPPFTVRSEKRGYKERSEAKSEASEPK